MKKKASLLLCLVCCQIIAAQRTCYSDGTITIEGDALAWTLATDGSQYPWVTSQYQWGKTYYEADGEIAVNTERRQDGGDIVETYSFTNTSKRKVTLKNIGIYTPFNDNYPVTTGLQALQQTGLSFERDMLLQDFKATADIFAKNGLNYPSFEVNYEQSIIAPAVQFLCEVYLATKEQKYLKAAQGMMPALEALSAQQPNYHQHEIAIRHWDGYWFGKRQTYGDVYPHYWSAITAAAYHYYAKATGKTEYQQRAENIVRGNLSLFFEDGRATCAFVFPRRVNGEPAHYADAYANDQDWALLFYILVNEKNI